MIAEMWVDGSSEVATIPPIEWPMIMIDVFAGYKERMYSAARDVYKICDSMVDPWKAERSSLNSTTKSGLELLLHPLED